MSFYLPKLWPAIRTRLSADATLTAIVPALYMAEGLNTDGNPMPLISYNIVSVTPIDAFKTATDEVTFDVHLFAERAGLGTDGGDIADTMATALNRIRGDWMDQTTRVPTFGLDRYTFTLTGSNCTCTPCERTNGPIEAHEDDTFHWISTFRLYISKAVS